MLFHLPIFYCSFNCIQFFAKDCIFLMTKIPGGNKVICRKPTGQIQEYTTKFTEAGMFQVCAVNVRYLKPLYVPQFFFTNDFKSKFRNSPWH